MEQAWQQWAKTGQAFRSYKDFEYQTRESWSRERRLVGKVEYLDKGANPRFVVTSYPVSRTSEHFSTTNPRAATADWPWGVAESCEDPSLASGRKAWLAVSAAVRAAVADEGVLRHHVGIVIE